MPRGFLDWPLSPEVQALKDERDRKGRLENKWVNNDHENIVEKIKCLSILGGCMGAAGGFFKMIHFDRPRSNAAAQRLMFRAIAPPVAMGAMYASTVKIVADVRQRDDTINHIAAGFVAGSIWGARTGSYNKGVSVGVFLACIGMVVKLSYLHNYDLLRGWAWVKDGMYHSAYTKEQLGFHHYNRSFYPGVPVQPLESEESLNNP